MTFTPRRVILKNKESVQVRLAVPEDAAQLIETIQTYIRDSEHLVLTTTEFQPTLEKEMEWISSFLQSNNSLLLVAQKDGNIIGNIDLNGGTRIKLQHTAMVGMGMLRQWRNTGLGTALLTAAIEWAVDNPVLEQLWLQVYHSNAAGMALYHKCGFREQGRQADFFKVTEGSYADNVLMGLSVKKGS